jgi:MFS family permease
VPGAISIGLGIAMAAALAAGRLPLHGRKGESGPQPGRGDMMRAFVILTVTMAAMSLIFAAMQTAMPRWFEIRMNGLVGEGGLGLGTLGVGALVAAVYVVVAFSQFAGGWAVDRWALRRVYLGGLVMLVPMMAVCALLTEAPLFLAVTVALFVHGALIPAETLLLSRYAPAGRRGLTFGARFVLAFGIAPVAVQVVAHSYRATGGFTLLLLLLSVAAAIALLAAAFLPGERAPQAAAVPAE